jgi:hypothetical protein
MKNTSNHTIEAKRSLCCLLLWVFEWVSERVSWGSLFCQSVITHSLIQSCLFPISSMVSSLRPRALLLCQSSTLLLEWRAPEVSEWVKEWRREGRSVCVWVSEWVPLWSIRCNKPLHHSTLISSPSLRYSSTSITWPHSCHVIVCVCVCVVPCSTSGDVDAAVQAGRK